ncbi:MAG: hypothetical protein WBC85_09215 [Planktotalea sp.]|uniref:hypothetical protein n=1 Tax=Planktotalea sp. TaxID=2029877 RepID=UPI003C76DE13
MTSLPRRARYVLFAALGLFAALNVLQVFAFGAPFGDSAALDLRMTGYTAGQARGFLEAIGEDGQRIFFGVFRWLDTLFPPLLAVSLVILFRHIRPRRNGVIIGLYALLPLAYLVADLTENTFLKKLRIEEGFDIAVRFANEATILKYSVLGVALLTLVIFWVLERGKTR